MDDAKIGHDIRERAYALMNGKRGLVPSDADLGRAAREVFAKPVATREALADFYVLEDGKVSRLTARLMIFSMPSPTSPCPRARG